MIRFREGEKGMADRVDRAGYRVAGELARFVEDEALPGTGVDAASFWRGFAALLADLTPRNRRLLQTRDDLQSRIDAWHRERRGQPVDAEAYRAFLSEIGYLVPEGADFPIETETTDPEFATIAGPQTRRPDHQRPLRAQRRQRPLGLALRRALRHRRAGRPAAGQGLRPRPRRPRRRPRQGASRRRRPARASGAGPTSPASASRAAPSSPALADPAQFAGHAEHDGAAPLPVPQERPRASR